MTPEEARAILEVYRRGADDAGDPFFAEALELASTDPGLGKWFHDEQAMDTAISGKLNSVSVPPGLKAALVATMEPRNTFEWTWPSAAGLAAAAALVTLLLALGFLRPGTKTGGGDALENFRSEMVNFVSIDPSLEMETGDLGKIREHLAANTALTSIDIPPGIQKLPAVGCRRLLFRGYKVGLLCFHSGGDRLAHLLVVNAAAFDGEPLPQEHEFRKEGDWMTATWARDGKLYVVASQLGQKELETLLAAAPAREPRRDTVARLALLVPAR